MYKYKQENDVDGINTNQAHGVTVLQLFEPLQKAERAKFWQSLLSLLIRRHCIVEYTIEKVLKYTLLCIIP